jgi:NADPH:quinone reductase-like Zn-dependent oxidoreductase
MAKQHGVDYQFIFVRSDGEQMRALSRLIDRDGIVPAVDPTIFTLDQINTAITYLNDGHPQGKVLIHFE